MILVSAPALAEETPSKAEICFNKPDSQKLLSELKSCQEMEEKLQSLMDKYSQEDLAQSFVVDNLTQRVDLLEGQLEDEHARAEGYKEEWDTCSDALTECQQSKPSRATWFGAGFGSALVVALIIIAL